MRGAPLVSGSTYYQDKLDSLKDLFGGPDVRCETEGVRVGSVVYPVLNDVIILIDPAEHSPEVRRALALGRPRTPRADFAEDVQFTFGEEWKEYPRILPEHEKEFQSYFDLVDVAALQGRRVCDLGCGIGRWSYFLKDKCRELVLVDFSDAVFVARQNLADNSQALFFMGDLRKLPFRPDFCDFLFSLGVLHHLPVPCLQETRALARHAPRLLVFLYYALDNRPYYFRWILGVVTALRRLLCRIRSAAFRRGFSWMGAVLVYRPLVLLGSLLNIIGLGRFVPLYEFYKNKSLGRLAQDVYDRFFTRIEQRVSRREIESLRDTFRRVEISSQLPYWHFLCER